jgi:hypothetical protein
VTEDKKTTQLTYGVRLEASRLEVIGYGGLVQRHAV